MIEKNNKEVFEEEEGLNIIQKQINESYQSGVVDDHLTNNRDIDSYNNKSK